MNCEPYELRRFAEYALNNRRGAVIGRVYLRLGVWGFGGLGVSGGWREAGELFVGGSGGPVALDRFALCW